MNLGQTLTAILALILFTTITVTINRTRINATTQTIDKQIELEAITYGQSLVEIISNLAVTEAGYNNLSGTTLREKTFTPGSGTTLYSKIEVNTSGALVKHGVPYKLVTVSIYTDSSREEQFLSTRYKISFSKWWNVS